MERDRQNFMLKVVLYVAFTVLGLCGVAMLVLGSIALNNNLGQITEGVLMAALGAIEVVAAVGLTVYFTATSRQRPDHPKSG